MLFFFSKVIFAVVLEIEEQPRKYNSIYYTYLIRIFSPGCYYPIKTIFSETSKFIEESFVKENVPKLQDFHIDNINLIFSSTEAKEIYLPFFKEHILSQLQKQIPDPIIIISNKIAVFQNIEFLQKENHLNLFTPYNFNNDSRIIDDFFLILTIVSNFSKQKDSEIVKNIYLYNSTYLKNLEFIKERLLRDEQFLLNDFLEYFFNEMNLKKNILSPENLKPSCFYFAQSKETTSLSLFFIILQHDLSILYTQDDLTKKRALIDIFLVFEALIKEIHYRSKKELI